MLIKGRNLCDFCFAPMEDASVCPRCGLTHTSYKPDVGLLSPGTNLMGKYIIGRALGRGGFGATYTAYSVDLDRAVAIKEYLPVSIVCRNRDDVSVVVISEDKSETFEKGAKRFFDEAKTISRFNASKNIVSVYEFFYANGTVYYSMEYLDGVDLKKYIDRKGGRLEESEAVRIMKEVCNALIVVHSTLVLHRDISPDNIFMCSNGDVKLIDFGAAKQVIADEQRSYSVVIKQGFAPAEQYSKKGRQGVWTDVYALGATFYYALMGEVPPDAIDRVENPELRFDLKGKNAGRIAAIIKKCMATAVGERYQSALELLGELEKIEIEEVIPYTVEIPQRDGARRADKGITGNEETVNIENKPNKTDNIKKKKAVIRKKPEKQPKVKKRSEKRVIFSAETRGIWQKTAIAAGAVVLCGVIAWGAWSLISRTDKFGSEQTVVMTDDERAKEPGKKIENIILYNMEGNRLEHTEPAYEVDSSLYISADRILEYEGYVSAGYSQNGDDIRSKFVNNETGREILIQKDSAEIGITEKSGSGKTEKVMQLGGKTFVTGENTYVHIRSFLEKALGYDTSEMYWDEGENTLYFRKTEEAETEQAEAEAETTAEQPKSSAPAKKTSQSGSSNSEKSSGSKQTTAKCPVCGSTSHTSHPQEPAKCSVCGSTAHTSHPTCSVCGSTSHTSHPQEPAKCSVCGSTAHTSHPTCSVCGSTAHTSHPTCSVCGSTSHTKHPTCPVCGSTAHTSHPTCPVCGSTTHSEHPAPHIEADFD